MNNPKSILDYFSLLKKRGIIVKSYLFVGDNFNLVKEIIKLINCKASEDFYCGSCFDCMQAQNLSHPDIFIVEPKGLSITIENIRECQQFLRLKSFCARKKIVVLKGAQDIGEAAANAFLKTLEEPPRNSLIMICASKLDSLLPTIISRCSKIFLPVNEDYNYNFDSALLENFLQGKRIEFKERSQFASFLWSFVQVLRYKMLLSEGINGSLLNGKDYEIICAYLKPKSINEYSDALKDVLEIYCAYTTINENLALNLIRERVL